MALAAASSTVGLTTPLTAAQKPFWLWVDGVDHIGDVDMPTIEITDTDNQSPARLRLIFDDEANTFGKSLLTQQWIQLYDAVNDRFLFQGWIQNIHPQLKANYARWEVQATDQSTALDVAYIVSDSRPIESDQARIEYLLGAYAHYAPFVAGASVHGVPTSSVQLLNAAVPAATYAKQTVRSAIEQILASTAGAEYHVDPNSGALITYTDYQTNAPASINDVGTATSAITDLETDGTPQVDAIFVNGANAAGSGLFYGPNAPHVPPRTAQVDAPTCTDAVTAAAIAAAELAARGPTQRVQITLTGTLLWERGQRVPVDSTVLGWSGVTLVIRGVTTTFMSGTGLRRFVLTCGSEIRTLSGQFSRLANAGLTTWK